MEKFNKRNLSKIVGQKISLQDHSGSKVKLLIKSVDVGSLDSDEWESFSVNLEGADEPHVPQGTYQVSHDDVGSQSLFVSPKSETNYEIVVNRKR